MKAWLTHDFGDMRLHDVPEPKVEPGTVKIKVEVCQPSVTDALRFRGTGTSGVDKVKAILEKQSPYQLFGHEFCGEVVEVGEGVTDYKIGDRVSSMGDIPCGKCRRCLSGELSACENMRRIGVNSPGCFAEYVVLPPLALEKISYDISGSEAACLQPFSSAVACVGTARLQLGDTVAVLGLGVMGLYCAQVARVSGAGTVIGADVKPEILELAKKLGIDIVIDSAKQDPVEFIKEFTKGRGADVVLEAAGGNPKMGLAGAVTLGQAFKAVRKQGAIIQVAHPYKGEGLPFDLSMLRKRSIKYLGPEPATSVHFQHGFNLIRTGRVNVKSMVSHVLDGIENVRQVFEITEKKGEYKATGPAQARIWLR